jgi:malonate-semialdehyde dehydrogenase (acetylating)/methylmalonate-semialdehyde dehydrogenase
MDNQVLAHAAHHLIGGSWQAGRGEKTIPIFDPAVGETFAEITEASPGQVDAAVEAAAAALPAWSALSISRRAEIVLKMKAVIEERIEPLAHALSVDNGKTLAEARGEIGRAAEAMANAASAPMIYHSESGNVAPGLNARRVRTPVGVCVAITPFNFPVMNPSMFAAWAIVCGNTLVLKPSEQTPAVTNMLVSLFSLAGVPDGVINVVHGTAEVGRRLTTHPKVAAISCITSSPVARAVYEAGAMTGKRVQANGGGKNPFVVLADADLDRAAAGIADAAFGMAGQRCLAASRCIVVDEIYDALLARLVENAKAYVLGNGRDPKVNMGPVVSAGSKGRIVDAIEAAAKAGAKIVLDGRQVKVEGGGDTKKGYFVGPTIIAGLSHKSPVESQELFGPFLALHRVKDLDEAVAIANDTEFGNAAAIYTSSGANAQAFEMLSTAGNIGVNTFPAPPMNFTMGGAGKSFYGDIHVCGDGAMHFYTDHKMVVTRW